MWYNVREGKSEHTDISAGDACISLLIISDANAPANPENRRFFGTFAEAAEVMVYMNTKRNGGISDGRTENNKR